MTDWPKRLLLAGLGVASLTRDRARKLVDELVHEGALADEERQRVFEELVERGSAEREELEKLVKKQSERWLQRADLARAEEVKRLRGQVEALEARLAALEGEPEEEA